MKIFSAPLNVTLGITNRCNLNCNHCLASSTRTKDDFTTEELLRLIEELRQLKVLNICIFGGEPLIRKDFFVILKALSALRVPLSLNTNGTLITKSRASKLARYPIRAMAVSLDGSCAKVHDAIRGQGAFRATISGIQNLIEKKFQILVSTTVTRYNHTDVGNIADLSKRLGCQGVRFNEVMYTGNAACCHESLVLTAKEKFALLDDLAVLKNRFGGFITGSFIQVLDIISCIDQLPREKMPLEITSCGAATSKCAIRPDGWVTPCEILWDLKAGNVKKQSLLDIWRNAPIMKEFRKTIKVEQKDFPECAGCKYLKLCYKGHRCKPYYYPAKGAERRMLYCWKN